MNARDSNFFGFFSNSATILACTFLAAKCIWVQPPGLSLLGLSIISYDTTIRIDIKQIKMLKNDNANEESYPF